jgi:alkylation response protein AidB-like acyl-CoA dehydrogenase
MTTPVQRLDEAIDRVLAEHDPATTPNVELRGARYDAGLAWVHFPEGFGGLGLPPELNRHVERRFRDAGAAPADPTSFFMQLAGPTIVTHGTDEQKQRFLRPMFTGEERWCQLFSEPGAGSDFAGLAARAVRDGDEWVVNGQKVWNTLAHIADWGMLVTRSDPDLPKHKGMTYFALDMRAPGVEVRPLRQITGEAEFNEVYLTDARVPDANRIGDEGEGWRVALTTLMNERTAIGAGSASSGKPRRGGAATDAVAVWERLDPSEQTAARKDRLMQLWVRGEVGRLTNMRAAQNARAGNPGPEGSVSKLEFANFNKELYDFCIDLLGMDGQIGYDYTFRRPDFCIDQLGMDGQIGYDYTFRRPTELDATGSATKGLQYAFLRVRANSIEGGTSEILKNILGEQVLGLPGEPRVDKDVPWIDVPRS